MMVKPEFSRLLEISSIGMFGGKVMDYCLDRFLEFGEKVK
jgi:hypothetical protein